MILDHKLQRMLNDSKIAQLNSESPLHQTAVPPHFGQEDVFFSWMASRSMCAYINVIIRSERMSEE